MVVLLGTVIVIKTKRVCESARRRITARVRDNFKRMILPTLVVPWANKSSTTLFVLPLGSKNCTTPT